MTELKPAQYDGKNFKVTYDKGVCTHAAVCVGTLPGVFNVKERPWVNTSGASASEIKDTIAKCPSGALQFTDE